jgi:hypothetical protein
VENCQSALAEEMKNAVEGHKENANAVDEMDCEMIPSPVVEIEDQRMTSPAVEAGEKAAEDTNTVKSPSALEEMALLGEDEHRALDSEQTEGPSAPMEEPPAPLEVPPTPLEEPPGPPNEPPAPQEKCPAPDDNAPGVLGENDLMEVDDAPLPAHTGN